MDEAEKKPGVTHPSLNRREAFARALAEGIALDRAGELAGYGPNDGKRVRESAARPHIAARIIEIRTERPQSLTEAEPLIAQLLDAATKARLLNSAAGYAAVRSLLAEAARLQSRVEGPVALAPPRPRLPEMTNQEWLAEYGPKRVTAT
jgi:hypothetical protein